MDREMMRVDASAFAVTVSEDRAHVTRTADGVALTAGANLLVIDGVAPVLVDKTVKITAPDGIAIVNVRVERRTLHTQAERPDDMTALDAALDRKASEEKDLTRARGRLENELAGLDLVIAQLVADIAADTAWGTFDADAMRARFRELEKEESAKRARFLEVAEQHRVVSDDLARLRQRRAASEHAATKTSARVVIEVTVEEAQSARIQLDYIVPGACWRPAHTARLVGDMLRFSTDACVWQNTGEAWTNADVTFSTERPSLGREPPLLAADRVSAQRKQDGVVVETRHEEIRTAGLGHDAGAASRAVPGIDDGGEPRVLRGAAPATIETDGRPHRVPLTSFETSAASALVMFPALATLAIRKTTQTNAGPVPILAGPVDLVEASGIVGRTQVLFVAPNERFELGWGPDPGVRAHRTVEEIDDEPSMLSSWLTRTFRVQLHVSSLDDKPRALTVTEAVPVSELEKVQVAVDPKETTDGRKPDEDGFVRWQVQLGPHGRASVKMRYTQKRHKDVTGI